MSGFFRDREHLFRAAVIVAVGLAVFLAARSLLVPADFGELGHYRTGALRDNAAPVPVFAGRQACEQCHAEQVGQRQGSAHAKVGCETCHGPQGKHAEDPGAAKPPLPEARELCLACHGKNVARPEKFPQVDPKDHGSEGPCSECHKPHHPEIS